jgi:hypothetical protein
MKRFLHWSLVPVLGVLALATFMRANAAEYRTQPAICVAVETNNQTGARPDQFYLRPMDGDSLGFDGSGEGGYCSFMASRWMDNTTPARSYSVIYMVQSVSPGHFLVHALFTIPSGKNLLFVTRELPVRQSKPDVSQWSKVASNCSAVAYLNTTPIR